MEIEFRLGAMHDTWFDTNIEYDLFQKIEAILKQYSGWKEVQKLEMKDEFFAKNVRCTTDILSGDVCIIKKKAIRKEVIPLKSPLGIRLAISEEKPVNNASLETCVLTRNKKRTRYIHNVWFMDLTRVDSNGKVSYECELEFHDKPYMYSHTISALQNEAMRQFKHILSCANM